MSVTPANAKDAAGFTLLEMLVALVVLGLLMAGLIEGVRYGIKSWQNEALFINRTAELDGVDRVLRDLFTGIDSGGDAAFNGGLHRVAFTGRLPPALPLAFQHADILLMVTEDHRLVLRWTPHPHATMLTALPSRDTELLRGVERIDLNYRASDSSLGTDWLTSDSEAVPALVRLRIVFQKNDPRHWPDLVIAPTVVPR